MTDDDTKQEYRSADTHTTFRIPNPTHARIKDHQRESETLAATMDRALDALEREQNLPDAVAQVMRATTDESSVGAEVGYALMTRAQDLHDDPADDNEQMAEDLADMGMRLINRYEPDTETGAMGADDG